MIQSETVIAVFPAASDADVSLGVDEALAIGVLAGSECFLCAVNFHHFLLLLASPFLLGPLAEQVEHRNA